MSSMELNVSHSNLGREIILSVCLSTITRKITFGVTQNNRNCVEDQTDATHCQLKRTLYLTRITTKINFIKLLKQLFSGNKYNTNNSNKKVRNNMSGSNNIFQHLSQPLYTSHIFVSKLF